MSKQRQTTEPIDGLGLAKFEEAIHRLVRVPKAEVEVEERKYRAMRERRKVSRAAKGKKPPKGG